MAAIRTAHEAELVERGREVGAFDAVLAAAAGGARPCGTVVA